MDLAKFWAQSGPPPLPPVCKKNDLGSGGSVGATVEQKSLNWKLRGTQDDCFGTDASTDCYFVMLVWTSQTTIWII